MGNQGGSGHGVKQMIKWFDENLIGTVSEVHVWTNRPVWPQGIKTPTEMPAMMDGLDWDSWIGPAGWVDYHPFKWRGWWNFGTGALGDMACHLIDPPFRVLGLGYPTEVESSVGAIYSRLATGLSTSILPTILKDTANVPGQRQKPSQYQNDLD